MDSFEGIIEFVAVAEAQGFSAAANQLGCSTSHVSRQIARLEERLGVALFVRSTRVVSLTKSGEVYYRQAKDLVVGLQQANEQVNQQQFQLSGSLKVSAAGGFAEHFVAPALMAFVKQHPNLSIELDLNSRYINFMEDGFDFAIRYGELNDSSLIARKLVSRPMMAVAHPDYLDKYGTPKHPHDLKNHHCIVTNNNQWDFTVDGRSEVINVKGWWRCNNANVVLEACTKALGIAYMPRSTFKEAVSTKVLVPVLAPFWGEGTNSWIVYPNKRFMPQRVRLAIDFLLQHFSQWDETG